MRTPRLVVQSSRTTRRGSVSISSAGTIPVAGQPEQSMAASGADDARIDHVRRRRGPVARRLRRCVRAAPSARNILRPGPTRLVNRGIALLGARARGAGPVDRKASAPRMQSEDAKPRFDSTRDSRAPATATSLAPGSAACSWNRDRRCSGHARPRARARTHIFACEDGSGHASTPLVVPKPIASRARRTRVPALRALDDHECRAGFVRWRIAADVNLRGTHSTCHARGHPRVISKC